MTVIDVHPESDPALVTIDRLGRGKYNAWLGDFPLVMKTTHPGHYAAIALQILGHTGWMVLRDRGASHDTFKPALIETWARHFAKEDLFVPLSDAEYAEHRARVQKFLDNPDATSMDEETV